MKANSPKPYISKKVDKIAGEIRVPGDKSMSHRALMLGGLATGETRITGLLKGHDVMNTAHAMRMLGARISEDEDGIWRCSGPGIGGLREPESVLDMGNSGTSARLLMGLVAGYPFATFFTGDNSLKKRPMRRVMDPLEQMGARFIARSDDKFPLAVQGSDELLCIDYETPVASAQIKSAILLAGLTAKGATTVIETQPSRDHTENMLQAFGGQVEVENLGDGRFAATVTGQTDLQDCSIDIPADPSSAAFPAALACLHPGSEITLLNVGINKRRTGFYDTLSDMGVSVRYTNERNEGGEPVADIRILLDGALQGVDVPPERVPSMIDEFPVLSVIAAGAEGTTHMTGLAELRVKESDRLALVAQGLQNCGVDLVAGEDSLTIHGTGKPPEGGARIKTALDHRIAMSFLILGSATQNPVEIDDISPVATSFPGFVDMMNELGTDITPPDTGE